MLQETARSWVKSIKINKICDVMSWTSGSIICSLGEELVKLSVQVPRQRFWLTFTFLLKTINGLIIKIPLIRTKILLLWDLN